MKFDTPEIISSIKRSTLYKVSQPQQNHQMSDKDLENVIHCKDFFPSTETVTFGQKKNLDNGSSRVPLKYDGNQLWMMSYKHRNPFGLSRGMPNSENYGKKLMCSLSFDRRSNRGKAFYDAMKQFEEVLIQTAYEKRVEWGLCLAAESAETTERDIRKMFNRMIRVAKDKEGNPIEVYEPTFRVEFNVTKDESTGLVNGVRTEVYNERQEKVDPVDESTIPMGSEAKCIMGAPHVYVQPGKSFGVTWKLHQLRVFPGSRLPTGRCLIRDDPEDSSDDEPADNSSNPVPSDEDSSSPSRPKLSLRS